MFRIPPKNSSANGFSAWPPSNFLATPASRSAAVFTYAHAVVDALDGRVRFGELGIAGERCLRLIEKAIDDLFAELVVVRNDEPVVHDGESAFLHCVDFDAAIIDWS